MNEDIVNRKPATITLLISGVFSFLAGVLPLLYITPEGLMAANTYDMEGKMIRPFADQLWFMFIPIVLVLIFRFFKKYIPIYIFGIIHIIVCVICINVILYEKYIDPMVAYQRTGLEVELLELRSGFFCFVIGVIALLVGVIMCMMERSKIKAHKRNEAILNSAAKNMRTDKPVTQNVNTSNVRICPSCGKKLNDGAAFCANCGAKTE